MATGALLNTAGIVTGGLLGLVLRRAPSVRAQLFLRSVLGASTIFFGLRLVWLNINGSFLSCLEQLLAALLAVALGFWLGRLLRLQKISDRLGQRSVRLLAAARSRAPGAAADSFSACAILFCAAPLAWLGAISDGLSGFFWLLTVKAVMDGLGTMGFAQMFRWAPILSAVPVFVFLSFLTLACRLYAAPFLEARHLGAPVNAAAGLVACTVALVILEIRKVELANFLPALAVAPLLAAWLR
ncbi:MAG: DUF554 family protein [Verrucomicrobiota bacterium]|nr:DUF554 family protein [Verrucomicrobiota bacterium]